MDALRFGLSGLALGWLTVTGAMEPNVVATRVEYPGASPEQIEREVVIPLERLLEKLQGVKSVRSRCDEGRLLVEVRFAGPAGEEELVRVAKPVQEFKAVTPSPIGTPLLSLEPASLR
jgi:hydrophobic/amphiphilic exporter-1 (mainly G- bacteria), HAE1 family